MTSGTLSEGEGEAVVSASTAAVGEAATAAAVELLVSASAAKEGLEDLSRVYV